MSLPLIGITTYRGQTDDGPKDFFCLSEAYVRAVQRAGGLPVMIPLGLSEEALQHLYSRLDGLILSGGGDVDPEAFGGGAHETLFGVDPDRDRVEFNLVRWAVAEDKPVLGICRGIQVMYVALGGSLYLDTSQIGGARKHAYFPNYRRDYLAHPVAVEEESLLARSVGAPIFKVNSLHHQAIRQPAPSLRVVARSPDGVIEAVERPDLTFALGVQWHPECLPRSRAARQLFHTFVQHTRSRTDGS